MFDAVKRIKDRLEQRSVQRSFGAGYIYRSARTVMVLSWLQIVVAAALLIAYIAQAQGGVLVLILLLVPTVAVGNFRIMQHAWRVLSFREQTQTMNDAIEQSQQLNRRLRAQRHDFANHLQVIQSLIQLEEYAQAEDYIRQVSRDIQVTGQVLRTSMAAVNALIAAKTAQAKERGLHMEIRGSASLEGLAMEQWEMCRVLGNLLDNAFDAAVQSHAPWITLDLAEGQGMLQLRVANGGPPIDEQAAAHLFEPGFTTKAEGQGMGLYIVRSTLEQYGGRVQVSSNARETVFSVTVPLQRVTS